MNHPEEQPAIPKPNGERWKRLQQIVRQFLAVPTFGDEQLDQLTAVMNIILLGTFLVLTLGLISMAPGRPVENPTAYLFSVVLAILPLLVRRWLFQGQARRAAFAFSLAFWGLVCTSVWLAGDIRISASFFFLAILVPTFLLGVGWGALALGGSIAAVFGVAVARDIGWLTPLVSSSSVSQAIVFTISASLLYGLFVAARQGLIGSLQQARLERDFSHRLIENLPGLLYVLDLQTGWGQWNANFARALALSPDELQTLLGRLPIEQLRTGQSGQLDFLRQLAQRLAEPESQEALFAALQQAMQSGHAEAEIWLRDADGTKRLYLLTMQRLTVGERRYLLVDGLDITSRRQAEERLRRLNLELEQRVQQRTAQLQASNEEMEAFVYSVSHDLRAPLRGIDGYTRLLEADFAAALPPEGRDYLQSIRQANSRMNRLIDDLLVLSRVARRNMEWEQVDLSGLAQEVVAELRLEEQSRSVRQGELTVTIQPDLQVYGDRHLLRILLVNLLGNAFKFTRKTSPAFIEVLQQEQADGKRIFQVRDNGAGFDMTYADRLFQPFQRLHAETDFEGSGIGLATVRRIVQRHGGEIWAVAAPGQGATFFFTLGKTLPD